MIKYFKHSFIVFLFAFSLQAQSKIFVNQIGYLPIGDKFVVSDNPQSTSFKLKESSTGNVVYEGQFASSFNNDHLSGMSLRTANFTDFTQEGKYYLEDNLGTVSYNFNIAASVYNSIYRASQKNYYFQRCGAALTMQYAGEYFHAVCHNTDAFYHESTGLGGFKYSIGGWHDAGDFGKYIVNAGITVGTMLLAYEMFPDYFASDSLDIPESGNEIPDILDEIQYELTWFLKMQDTSGGVFAKLTAKQFAAFEMPQNDHTTRYLYEISSAATADFAAVLAKASRIFFNFDSGFANDCLNASRLAWNYLENHPNIVPVGGFRNPGDTGTGEYGDGNDGDERLWAASELYATTHENEFSTYYESKIIGVWLFKEMSWPQVAPLANLTYLLFSDSQNSLVLELLSNSLNSFAAQIIAKMNGNGFSIPLNDGEFNWGSNSRVLNAMVLLIADDYYNGNSENNKYIMRGLDYILGINPNNFCYVSGFGTNRLMHPHHRASESDNVVEPIPGMLAGGPNQYLNDPTLQEMFNQDTPSAMTYVDTVSSYASNEVAINWNAPLMFVLGYLNGIQKTTGVEDSKSNITPEKFEIFPNYPNPFNGYTCLVFSLPVDSDINIKIFDSLGREVMKVEKGFLLKGRHHLPLSFSNQIDSGVYFYKIINNTNSINGKMVYLK